MEGVNAPNFKRICCRSPHGERGLKFAGGMPLNGDSNGSLPSRGAWIEIQLATGDYVSIAVAPLTGSVD